MLSAMFFLLVFLLTSGAECRSLFSDGRGRVYPSARQSVKSTTTTEPPIVPTTTTIITTAVFTTETNTATHPTIFLCSEYDAHCVDPTPFHGWVYYYDYPSGCHFAPCPNGPNCWAWDMSIIPSGSAVEVGGAMCKCRVGYLYSHYADCRWGVISG
ncbi:uncharacterized protein LOC118415525 isoform X2 [Branchiostoma floridae]|uniref:Uncharacterized protein LOC118415525 isoform X2 n=1 Tax=Branchiostoma floridae TaxID=7739 RepID=A0A9J7L6C0_BRAFL|nr:uncharacterized protein LOC118415525 isoform X2 [Branchiostoma floridae]